LGASLLRSREKLIAETIVSVFVMRDFRLAGRRPLLGGRWKLIISNLVGVLSLFRVLYLLNS